MPAADGVRVVEGALAVRPGVRLPLTSWLPPERPRAVIVALHSYGDFRLGYEEVGPWLAARGVAVHAYDQQGFGEAPGHGLWSRRARLVGDLQRALRLLAPADGTPLLVMGESLGGGVALAAMLDYRGPPLAGLVLAEPAVRAGIRLRYVWDLVFGGLALVRPGYRQPLARGRHPQLTDTARQRLASDPRIVRHIRADSYKALLSLADAASRAARRLRVPTLLLYGRADGIIPLRLFERAARDLAGVGTVLHYPAMPHLLLQVEGYTHVLEDVLAWMEGHALPAPGSPALLRRLGPRPEARS